MMSPLPAGASSWRRTRRSPAPDDRMSVGGSDVAHPLGFPGQGHQVVAALVAGSQDGDPSGLTRGAASYLEGHRVPGCQSQGGEPDTQPVQPLVPGGGRPVRGASGVVLWLQLASPSSGSQPDLGVTHRPGGVSATGRGCRAGFLVGHPVSSQVVASGPWPGPKVPRDSASGCLLY